MSIMLEVLSQRKDEGMAHASNQEIIGIEIRRKRLELSYTLAGLCFDICSPSYLCKIERNQIQANYFILQEICNRVAINDEQQELLFHSYEVLMDSLKAYVCDDVSKLDSYVLQGKGFENYRYRIIQFMKYIRDNQLYLAKEIYNELVKLLSSMQSVDMVIFSMFTVILEYKERNYQEALSILKELEGILMDDNLSILYHKYLFLTSTILLRQDSVFFYNLASNKIKDLGYYSKLEELNYALGIYALKVKSDSLLSYANRLLHQDINKNTLIFLEAYLDHNMDIIEEYKNKPLSEFATYLASILDGKDANKEMIFHLNNAKDNFDFSANLLKYLALETPDEKRLFIIENVDYYKKVKDVFVSNYFMMELLRMNQDKPHNKETITTLYDYFIKREKK